MSPIGSRKEDGSSSPPPVRANQGGSASVIEESPAEEKQDVRGFKIMFFFFPLIFFIGTY